MGYKVKTWLLPAGQVGWVWGQVVGRAHPERISFCSAEISNKGFNFMQFS